MANGKRSIGLFGIGGVLAAVLIISAFVVGGNIIQAQAKGTLIIQVMDAPTQLSNLEITIDWARIQGESGGWVNLDLKITGPLDLLELKDVSAELSETPVPADSYSMIEMHVLSAKATYLDATVEDLTVPSDVIKVLLQPHMVIESEGKVTVLIDLQPNGADSIAASHSLNIHPVLKAVVG